MVWVKQAIDWCKNNRDKLARMSQWSQDSITGWLLLYLSRLHGAPSLIQQEYNSLKAQDIIR